MVPELRRIISECFFANLRQAFIFFLDSNGFCGASLQWVPFLPRVFIMVESWTLTLAEAWEACNSLDVFIWMILHLALGEILEGHPLLGILTTLPIFLHLDSMALIVVQRSLRALEMAGFVTFSRLIDIQKLVFFSPWGLQETLFFVAWCAWLDNLYAAKFTLIWSLNFD